MIPEYLVELSKIDNVIADKRRTVNIIIKLFFRLCTLSVINFIKDLNTFEGDRLKISSKDISSIPSS
jgi:hypothetical protein